MVKRRTPTQRVVKITNGTLNHPSLSLHEEKFEAETLSHLTTLSGSSSLGLRVFDSFGNILKRDHSPNFMIFYIGSTISVIRQKYKEKADDICPPKLVEDLETYKELCRTTGSSSDIFSQQNHQQILDAIKALLSTIQYHERQYRDEIDLEKARKFETEKMEIQLEFEGKIKEIKVKGRLLRNIYPYALHFFSVSVFGFTRLSLFRS